MTTVETAACCLLYNPILRKTMKWGKKVVLWLISCALFRPYGPYKAQYAGSQENTRNFFLKQKITGQECKQDLETATLRMKKVCRALIAGYWAGKQAGEDSDTQHEEDVQTVLIAGYWAGMQVGGKSDTQEKGDVQRALDSRLRDRYARTKRRQ
jgi:hypothetical protein